VYGVLDCMLCCIHFLADLCVFNEARASIYSRILRSGFGAILARVRALLSIWSPAQNGPCQSGVVAVHPWPLQPQIRGRSGMFKQQQNCVHGMPQ
jgi:hypothetical protein